MLRVARIVEGKFAYSFVYPVLSLPDVQKVLFSSKSVTYFKAEIVEAK